MSFTSESNELELKASLAEPALNWKTIQAKAKALKNVNSAMSEQITTLKDEIEKLWLLKLSPQEKQVLSNHVKHSLAKNLAAFANTKGGEIYVGIEDDFTAQGMIYDLKSSRSEEDVRRLFDNLQNSYLGLETAALFQLTFIDLDFPILRIKIEKAKQEVWVKIDETGRKLEPTKEEFYIRGQQQTTLLSPKEYFTWKTMR